MDISAEINVFNNLKLQTEETAGKILWIEFKMRYLAERSQKVVDKLNEVTNLKDEDQKYYWNCKLDDLLKAIKNVFLEQLNNEEINIIDQYQMVRNRYLHSNFVGTLEKLGLSTGGRLIKNGQKVPLEKKEIGESLKALHTNDGIRAVKSLINSVENVLDKFLKST